MASMNRLSNSERARVVGCLVEGNSLRATARMTGVARMTIEKLLRDLGAACAEHHDATVRNLKTRQIQCDEIWSFCYAKKKNVTPQIAKAHPDVGDIWTWTAIDADSKLIVSWHVAHRTPRAAFAFMHDVAARLANRVQLTTDGFKVYFDVVDDAFAGEIDYAILHKVFANEGGTGATHRQYSSRPHGKTSRECQTPSTSQPAPLSVRT